MIKEAYCNPEIAELLKKKGMDKECFTHYIQKNNSDGTSEAVTTCTQQMAMKWLREVHKLYVTILYSKLLYGNKPFYWYIERLNKKPVDERFVKTSTATEEYTYRTYEQAIEAAIRYSLKNLI